MRINDRENEPSEDQLPVAGDAADISKEKPIDRADELDRMSDLLKNACKRGYFTDPELKSFDMKTLEMLENYVLRPACEAVKRGPVYGNLRYFRYLMRAFLNPFAVKNQLRMDMYTMGYGDDDFFMASRVSAFKNLQVFSRLLAQVEDEGKLRKGGDVKA